MTRRAGAAPIPIVVAMALALPVVLLVSMCTGREWVEPAVLTRAVLAVLGLADPLTEPLQTIAELRIWRSLTAAGVGASLALSGAFLQGVFRNPLAAPSLLGVTSGASLGAAIAILIVGGYAPNLVVQGSLGAAAVTIPLFGFLGALGAPLLIVLLAGREGRMSTPTLLLFGIAVNMCIGGVFAALQSAMLRDWEVSRAIMSWTFGMLDDRSSIHVLTVWLGLSGACVAIPFVAGELDLFKGGESDALSLGVDVRRTKLVALAAAALAAATAVAVAGQIAFVGLVVPHIVRLMLGSRHRVLLPLSALGGALFLLGADLIQRAVLGEGVLQPGVMMSLLGGPFFVWVLATHRREAMSW